jgi:hypothetical protein
MTIGKVSPQNGQVISYSVVLIVFDYNNACSDWRIPSRFGRILWLFSMIVEADDFLHHRGLGWDKSQYFSGACFIDSSKPNVPLHGFEVLPSADFHNNSCRNSSRNKLGSKASTQSVEFHSWKSIRFTKSLKNLGLFPFVPLPMPRKKKIIFLFLFDLEVMN